MSVCLIDDVGFHLLIQVVSVGFVCCKAAIFLFVVNENLREDTFEKMQILFFNLVYSF